MRTLYLFGSLPALLLTASAGAPSTTVARAGAPGAPPESLCRSGETVVYSCRFGRRVGSVCASGASLHYRYGRPARPEIDLASADDWSNVRVGRVVGQGGGHQTHVRFSAGEHHYIVFEGVDGSLANSPGRTYSGIHVARGADGGEQLAYHQCSGAGTVPDSLADVLRYAPEAIRDGDTLWEQENGPFDAWF